MSWFKKRVKKFKQLSTHHTMMHVTVKFISGVGIGILLAVYLQEHLNWEIFGWLLIIISLILAIPTTRKILGGK